MDESIEHFDFKVAMRDFVDAITNKGESAFVKSNELVLGKKLGVGRDGEVFKSSWLGTDVAVKYFRYSESKSQFLSIQSSNVSASKSIAGTHAFSNEVAIMMGLRHPNILTLMGFGVEPPSHFIVMEYMPKGSLFELLGSDENLPPKIKKEMAMGIANGLRFMHERNPTILHSDIKSLNILVDQDYTVKISDFGISRELRKKYADMTDEDDSEDQVEKNQGTVQWLPPEAFAPNAVPTKQTDIYGFGVILWEISTRRRPWKGLRKRVVAEEIVKGKRPGVLESDQWPESLVKLVSLCWHQDPLKRPLFKSISKSLDRITWNK